MSLFTLQSNLYKTTKYVIINSIECTGKTLGMLMGEICFVSISKQC